MRSKESTKSATPSIQVIERMFTLIDVLASTSIKVNIRSITWMEGVADLVDSLLRMPGFYFVKSTGAIQIPSCRIS